jgi:hypothetical protein
MTLAAGLALLAAAGASGAAADRSAGGDHWRLATERGVVHVWRPDGYDERTAGTVVYVHGYFTTADGTWDNDRLAEQFGRSERNALFVVSEAPAGADDEVRWDSVDALMTAVREGTGLERPPGSLVTIGHSGGFRTLLPWLRASALDQVVLLDGLYGDVRPFRQWLSVARGRLANRMILVAAETLTKSRQFARRVRGSIWRDSIPESEADLKPAERRARLLCLRSQYDHAELVTGGKVLSFVLRLAPLSQLPDVKAAYSPDVAGAVASPSR